VTINTTTEFECDLCEKSGEDPEKFKHFICKFPGVIHIPNYPFVPDYINVDSKTIFKQLCNECMDFLGRTYVQKL
jgi:hypothetical protein